MSGSVEKGRQVKFSKIIADSAVHVAHLRLGLFRVTFIDHRMVKHSMDLIE